jgi:hypothetical protein
MLQAASESFSKRGALVYRFIYEFIPANFVGYETG